MKHATLVAMVAWVVPFMATAADEGMLTKEESADVDAVIAAAIRAGFPDATGAAVYVGKLAVQVTFDPAKGHPLPSAASTMQATIPNSTLMTYGYEFGGLHLKLPEGAWIIGLGVRYTPGKNDVVHPENAKPLNLATLPADAAAAHPFDAATAAAKWIEGVPADERPRAVAAMNRLVPLTQYLNLGPDVIAPGVICLARTDGGEAAKELAIAIAQQRSRNYWQLRPWTATAEPAFDPTGRYPAAQEEEAAWRAAQTAYPIEAPAVALRRALFRWARAQVVADAAEDALVSPEAASAIAKACVDPQDPQHHAAKIDALLAGAKLPVTPQENATLEQRLASWEARARMPRMTVRSGGAPKADGSVSISTAFVAPTAAYTPEKKDLDALVALLGDSRPTRFNDFTGPRTIGDNAWRACATLLEADPRKLAGHPTANPWTDAERRAASTAVQAWWKGHRGEYLKE